MKQQTTVAEVLARDLAAYGARRCFGLLGTANFRISHALVEAGVELVSARHECNAASMGDAVAVVTALAAELDTAIRGAIEASAERDEPAYSVWTLRREQPYCGLVAQSHPGR